MSDSHIRQHSEQRSPLNCTGSHSQPPSSYWGKLSKIWLTKRALKELNRRNIKSNEYSPPYRPFRRSLTRSLLAEWAKGQQSASDILDSYSEKDLEGLKQFSRVGGPDTSDLRGYPEPINPLDHSTMPPTNHPSTSKKKDATNTVNTAKTGPYSCNFEQLLIDYGVFPAFYEYPDGRKPAKPKNLVEIQQISKQRRPSLSASRITDEEFEKFQEAAANAKEQEQTTQSTISIIEGNSRSAKCVCGKIKFENLKSLIDLNGDCALTPGNPDLYDGACSEQLDRRIRNSLKDVITPSTQDDLPMAPNFFLHANRDGTEAVAARQSVYDGALGERCQFSLRSYGRKELQFNNNAHTITSVYLYPTLSMYTVYTARTKGRQEYYTHLIGSWAMNGDIKTFRKGAAAFRNLRDWAKERRDEAITLANNIVDQVESEKNSDEKKTRLGMTSNSTLRAMSNAVDLSDDQSSSSAKHPPPEEHPAPASKRGRSSKRTKTKR